MKAILIVFLSLLLLFMLLSYPLPIRFKGHVNVVKMVAFYSIKFWFIKFLCGKTYIEDSKLIIQNTNNMLYSSPKKPKRQQRFIMELVKHITIAKSEIYFCAGIKDDAYSTALMCGYAYAVSSCITSVLLTRYQFANVMQDIDPIFSKDSLDLSVYLLLEISILDILVAKIKSLLIKE